jgi:hypothetical protein
MSLRYMVEDELGGVGGGTVFLYQEQRVEKLDGQPETSVARQSVLRTEDPDSVLDALDADESPVISASDAAAAIPQSAPSGQPVPELPAVAGSSQTNGGAPLAAKKKAAKEDPSQIVVRLPVCPPTWREATCIGHSLSDSLARVSQR